MTFMNTHQNSTLEPSQEYGESSNYQDVVETPDILNGRRQQASLGDSKSF
jgi:hypothetical protein